MTRSSRRLPAGSYVRYWYDRAVTKGLPGLLFITFVGAATLLLVVTPALLAIDAIATGHADFGRFLSLYWGGFRSLFRAGTASGPWHEQLQTVLFAIIALLFSGAVLGTVIHALRDKMERLREGGGQIIATEHTVLLGWSRIGFTIVNELALQNLRRGRAWIAILSSEHKSVLEGQLTREVSRRTTRIAVRSASQPGVAQLDLVRVGDARSVIVLGDWTTADHDTDVITGLLLLRRYTEQHPQFRATVVAGLVRPENMGPARVAAGPEARLVSLEELMSRLTFQVTQQPGLIQVFEALFSSAAAIQIVREPRLTGRLFGETAHLWTGSTPIGLVRGDQIRLLPPRATVIGQGDGLVVVTGNDAGFEGRPAEAAGGGEPRSGNVSEGEDEGAWLYLGWSRSLAVVLDLHDKSLTMTRPVTLAVPPEHTGEAEALAQRPFRNLQVIVATCPRDRPLGEALAEVELASLARVVIFVQRRADGTPSDADTLLARLQLADLFERDASDLPPPVVVTELVDDRFRSISPAAFARNMVVGSRLVALMFAQLSDTPGLLGIYPQLLGADGIQLRLSPASLYLSNGDDRDTTYAEVVSSANLRGEVALGYRLASEIDDRDRGFGVHITPAVGGQTKLGREDSVLVIRRVTDPPKFVVPDRSGTE